MNWLKALMRPLVRRAASFAGVSLKEESIGSFLWGPGSSTGIDVDADVAMSYSPWHCGVRILSEGIASLPCRMYERQGGDEETRTPITHPLEQLLQWQPNSEMTAFSFFETQQRHLINRGNCYAEIEVTKGGDVVALWPLTPWRVRPDRSPAGDLFYRIDLPDGGRDTLPAEAVLHVVGPGNDGTCGEDLVELASESIGLALAAEKHGSLYFGNSAEPGGVLTHPGVLKKVGRDQVRKEWYEDHGGLSNRHRIAILEEGLKYEKVGDNAKDAQLNELRTMQVADVARWLNLPPHLLKDLSRATFSNIEQQALEFVIYSLRPWLIRWEQALRRRLLTPAEKLRNVFFEFSVDALLRGDRASRYSAHTQGIAGGWLKANEARREENLPPADGGDILRVPANLQPAAAQKKEA